MLTRDKNANNADKHIFVFSIDSRASLAYEHIIRYAPIIRYHFYETIHVKKIPFHETGEQELSCRKQIARQLHKH